MISVSGDGLGKVHFQHGSRVDDASYGPGFVMWQYEWDDLKRRILLEELSRGRMPFALPLEDVLGDRLR